MPIHGISKSLKSTVVLLTAFTSFGLAACGTSGSPGSSGPVTFGAVIPLTGQYAVDGTDLSQGLSAAVASINDAGGILGRKATVQVADTFSDPVDALPAAKSVINVRHAVVQVGAGGPDAQATYRLFSQARIPFFLAGGDTYFDNNTDPYVWRLTPSDNQLGVAMAAYAYHKGYRNIALMFTAGVQEQLNAAVRSAFIHLGGKIAVDTSIQSGLSSYTATVDKIVAAHPDAILSETDIPSMAVVIRDMAATGHLTIPIIGTDTMVSPDMLKAIGLSVAERVMTNVEAGLFNSPATAAFTAAVHKVTKSNATPDPGASNTYDGVIIAALAMDMAKSTSGSAFNADIQKVTAPGGIKVYNYADGQRLIKAGKRITYIGAGGPFYFNANHNIYGVFVAVKPDASGQYNTIYSLSPDAIKQAAP